MRTNARAKLLVAYAALIIAAIPALAYGLGQNGTDTGAQPIGETTTTVTSPSYVTTASATDTQTASDIPDAYGATS